MPRPTRRRFVTLAVGGVALGAARLRAQGPAIHAPRRRPTLRTAVKWGMIRVEGPAIERFRLCKELGFDGMELVSPNNPPIDELRAASATTEMPIHGVVNDRHWEVRLSSPDPATRADARATLERAVRDTHALGGHSVLLVPGVVGDEATHDEVWRRSIDELRKVLPTCAALGVRVLIENVWNGFCETPALLCGYLDEVASPWVGSYYDIGNSQKFSPSEEWIAALGPRIVKLDVKDWGVAGGFGKIGEGDVNWPAVREALAEIGYDGWCTAEVEGGGRAELADILRRMNEALRG